MKLLTWNVQWFKGLDGVVNVGRVLAHARSLCDFDVLCLQEVASGLRGLDGIAEHAGADQVAAVANLLPDFEVFFSPSVDYRSQPTGPRERFGNLVATRLPALLVEHQLLPLVREGSTPGVRRVCTSVLIQASSGPLTIMNTHLEYHSAAQRTLQVQRLLEIHRENADLAAHSIDAGESTGLYQQRPRTGRSVLCGDFNFDVGSPEYQSLLRGNGSLALRDVGVAIHGSNPQRAATFGCYDKTYATQPVACDHVFATRELAAQARRYAVDGVTRLSDHQPVYVEWGNV